MKFSACGSCGRPMAHTRRRLVPAGYIPHRAHGLCGGCFERRRDGLAGPVTPVRRIADRCRSCRRPMLQSRCRTPAGYVAHSSNDLCRGCHTRARRGRPGPARPVRRKLPRVMLHHGQGHTGDVDELAVERAVNGRNVPSLTGAELDIVVRVLIDRGMSSAEIAARLRTYPRRVDRRRAYLKRAAAEIETEEQAA